MTDAVAADSNRSARATSGRRTPLRVLVLLAVVASVVMVGAPAFAHDGHSDPVTLGVSAGQTVAEWVDGVTVATVAGYSLAGPAHPAYGSNGFTLTYPDAAKGSGATAQLCRWQQSSSSSSGPACDTPVSFGSSGSLSLWVDLSASWYLRHVYVTVYGYTVAPAPEPCQAGYLPPSDFGGFGGGGSWDGGPSVIDQAGDVLSSWGDLFWRAANNDALWRAVEWSSPLGYYVFKGTSEPVPTGQYDTGGGGGGEWAAGIDCDADGDPDALDGTEDPGDTYITIINYPPPAPVTDPDAPSGGCDFGITDPSSWLCSLLGVFQRVLAALGSVVAFLRDLGGFLVGLLVPDPDVLQGQFADVETAWDASGPGQLTGGVTTVAAPLLNLDANMPTTCEGPQFTLPLGMSKTVTINPFSTCASLSQYILTILMPLMSALVYIGGFFLALRIVTKPFGMDTPGTDQAATA